MVNDRFLPTAGLTQKTLFSGAEKLLLTNGKGD